MTMATVAAALAAGLSALAAFRQEGAEFESNLYGKQINVFATNAEQFDRAEVVIGQLRPLIIQFNSTHDQHIDHNFKVYWIRPGLQRMIFETRQADLSS